VAPEGDVLVVDRSVDALEYLRDTTTASNVFYLVGSMDVLPLTDASADEILATAVPTVDAAAGGAAARAIAVLRSAAFRVPIRTVRTDASGVTLSLGDGVELRFGEPADLRLKLAVVRRALPFVPAGSYLDVSVPQRPVAGSTLNSKVKP
jgi:hypothetical protein